MAEWDLSPSAINHYIAKANQIISEKDYSDIEAEKKKALLIYDEVIQK